MNLSNHHHRGVPCPPSCSRLVLSAAPGTSPPLPHTGSEQCNAGAQRVTHNHTHAHKHTHKHAPRTSAATATSWAVMKSSSVSLVGKAGVVSQDRSALSSMPPATSCGMAMVRVPRWYFNSTNSITNARTSTGVLPITYVQPWGPHRYPDRIGGVDAPSPMLAPVTNSPCTPA